MARYGVANLLLVASAQRSFPLGTLGANLLGCLLIGAVSAMLIGAGSQTGLRLFFVAGLLGGFTTFSSFSLETLDLLRSGRLWVAVFYVAVSVLGGLLLTLLGWTFTRLALIHAPR